MEIKNNVPYVVIGLLFVIGLCLAAGVVSVATQFGPEQIAEGFGIQAEIPERVEHLEAMNDIAEGIAEGIAPSKVENQTSALTARAQVWRAAGMIGALALVVFGGMRVHRMIVEAEAQGRERRAAAGLREVQAEKEEQNPAFTPAGLLTRTTVIAGETFVSSDLTGDMAPVRDSERMKDFRQAHLAAMMAAIAAKRDVLIARAQNRQEKQDEVILIGEGL